MDDPYTAAELAPALRAAHAAGARRLVVNNLNLSGETAPDGSPGLLAGVRDFLREHPEWAVVSYADATVTLSRDPADRPQLPATARQGWNYLKSKVRRLIHPGIVPDAVAKARLDVCWTCPARNLERCSVCGCHLVKVPEDSPIDPGGPGKAFVASERCPLGLWRSADGGELPPAG